MTKQHMRQWAAKSYDSRTGRAASAVMNDGEQGWTHGTGDDQIATTHAPGQGGAPGADGLTKSGSGDPGRRKWARVP